MINEVTEAVEKARAGMLKLKAELEIESELLNAIVNQTSQFAPEYLEKRKGEIQAKVDELESKLEIFGTWNDEKLPEEVLDNTIQSHLEIIDKLSASNNHMTNFISSVKNIVGKNPLDLLSALEMSREAVEQLKGADNQGDYLLYKLTYFTIINNLKVTNV